MPIDRKRILYQDDCLLVVLKLSGELVVKGKGRVDRLPLLDFLGKEFPGLRAVHRLDFETSGVVVFAKNRQTLEKITQSRFSGWTKRYHALVSGRVERKQGTINIPLPLRSGKGEAPAETQYEVMEQFPSCVLVEATIERGAHHQIRRHFAKIGHPLVLDDEYGNPKFSRSFTKKFHYRRFFLHACSIDFPHPLTGEKMHIEAEMPRAFLEILQRLRQ